MKLFAAVVLLLSAWSFVHAGPPEPPVVLSVDNIEAQSVAAGDSLTVKMSLSLAKGYHVNANPAASDLYIPLEIVLTDTNGIHFGKPVYPKGKKWHLKGSDEMLLVYGGKVIVSQPLRIDKTALTGEQMIKGRIDFQACNDELCLMPDSLPFSLPVVIRK